MNAEALIQEAKSKYHGGFPAQQIPNSKKNKIWRVACVEWADNKSFFNYAPVRNSILHKKINYDLFNGILHMQDLEQVLNPEHLSDKTISSSNIQHYPIINSKLNILRGEEIRRPFDYTVIITNPNSISELEEAKKNEIVEAITKEVENTSQSEEDFNAKMQKLAAFFKYNWKDIREQRANNLLNHYKKEYNFPLLFNTGFMDAVIVNEEMYQCDIRGGEPVIERLNPNKVSIFRTGYSNKVEDADMIVIEDYWSPGQIIDAYYEDLTDKDIKYIESAPNFLNQENEDNVGARDERLGFINRHMLDDTITMGTDEKGMGFFFDPLGLFDSTAGDLMPFDTNGNVKVLKVFWKSRRKIKKVKSYDPVTGDTIYNFYDEYYTIREELGEEEEIFYVNEAWEGVKIGKEVFLNIRPRTVQYNRLSNPSRCHFGIVGSIMNINDSKPYSLVDMMKPYNYLYDVVHDRLNKLIAKNWGKLLVMDFAKVPKGWDVDKWLYFAKKNSIIPIDSFKEGNIGAATGKLAGAMNNASSGVVDAELGNSIQMHINVLEYIKAEMAEVVGISKQREGQISNRETVGGVERANLQSSHITEWVFSMHDDVKRRAIECFLETAKIALKGKSKKFKYLLSDGSEKVEEIDGDEFAENDYGLVVDNSSTVQELNQKLDMLAQAALQNQALSFSTIMKLYNSSSLAEKQRYIENDEQEAQERAQQAQQQQAEQEQQALQAKMQMEQAKMEQEDRLNQRDNETKILVANITHDMNKSEEDDDGIQEPEYLQEAKDKLEEMMRQFDERLALDKEKLELERHKVDLDSQYKNKMLNQKKETNSTKK